MKKPNTAKGNQSENPTPKKEFFNRVELTPWSTDKTMTDAKIVSDKRTIYPLLEGVNLTIQETDGNYDLAHLELFGVDIFCVVREGKQGAFLSYPSYKGKDGNYVDEVSNFSKSLNKAIRDLLAKLYTE